VRDLSSGGQSALHAAAAAGDAPLVQLLLVAGTKGRATELDIERPCLGTGWTALMHAAACTSSSSAEAVVEALLAAGARLGQPSDPAAASVTPLELARSKSVEAPPRSEARKRAQGLARLLEKAEVLLCIHICYTYNNY
jgi:ankyrin repeat protein